jgi:cell wall-associated NlpC family hydrolase
MISQLLFGEMVEVLEQKGRQWTRVRCQEDNFVGWVSTQQLEEITPSEFESYQKQHAFVLDLIHPAQKDDAFIPITLGARLPDFDGMRFRIGSHSYSFTGQAVFPEDITAQPQLILKIARRYLHAPMLWGGRSPFGLDSAGLVQVVYRLAGKQLPREAFQQVLQGESVDFVEQAQAGDLAFFENQAGRITHTGILFPENQILHVYGKARMDRVDHYGIYNEELKRYTHRLRIVKRVLPMTSSASPAAHISMESIEQQMELF